MSRVRGNNQTLAIDPKVDLVTMTGHPVESLFSLWHGSRHETFYPVEVLSKILGLGKIIEKDDNKDSITERLIKDGLLKINDPVIESCISITKEYPEYCINDCNNDDKVVVSAVNVIKEVAKLVIKCDVPASECVQFTFSISNASVAFREQLVRSRASSIWCQTSRTADLTKMDVRIDPKIESNSLAKDIYTNAVNTIRNAYESLSELGIPTEDIRLAPESRLHRVYWTINIRALRNVLAKRLDWMAQATLWSPVVEQILDIMDKLGIREYFLVDPQVQVADGIVTYHKYDNENEDRYYGRDPQPVDPLWLAYKGLTMPEHTNLEMYDDMKSKYIKMWSKKICDVLGWDKDNPTKLGKYDRPVK